MVVVVVAIVPSFSATIDDGQYQYLLATKGDEQSKSERLREMLHTAMKVEQDE